MSKNGAPPGALDGLRVVELAGGIAAAYCAKLLADLGADTIRVEPPEGAADRRAGPFPGDIPDPERSGLALYLNTNKRGLTLNLASRAIERLHPLLDGADLLIYDLAPARATTLGLEYTSLHARYPRLVLAAISAFGASGPYRDFAGDDLTAFAISGYAAIMTRGVEQPRSLPPRMGPFHSATFLAGATAATGAIAALHRRERDGSGGLVDVAVWETLAHALPQELAHCLDGKHSRDRGAPDLLSRSLVYVLPCRDGLVAVSPREAHLWTRWLEVLDNPTWTADERFGTHAARQAHWDEVWELTATFTRTHTKQEIVEAAQAQRVPAFPLSTVRDLSEDPQLRARGFFASVEHPRAGRVTLPSAPYHFSKTPWSLRRPAPVLGQDSWAGVGFWASGVGDPAGGFEASAESEGVSTPERLPADDRLLSFAASPDPRRPKPDTRPATRALPLAGVRVLDFSWVIAGPLCTRLLAELGAEVIRVETAQRSVYRAPSSYYQALGHSKLSLTINLGDERGKALTRALLPLCDVVVENFSTGVMERLGLGYEELRRLRPEIIMVSSSGLGRSGPRADYLAYGSLLQIYTGWAGLAGFASRPEVTIGGAWVDAITAIAEAFAVQAALWHRDRTGEGQMIDLSMAEAALCLLPEPLLDFELNGRVAEPAGNADPTAAPHDAYPCAGNDRWIAISVRDDAAWKGLQAAMSDPAWARDERFADLAGRQRHAEELDQRLAAWTEQQDEQTLFHTLQANGVAAAPVLSLGEVMQDSGARARGFFPRVEQTDGTSLPAIALPWADEGGGRGRIRPVPPLGADNTYVLSGLLGLSANELEALKHDGVLA